MRRPYPSPVIQRFLAVLGIAVAVLGAPAVAFADPVPQPCTNPDSAVCGRTDEPNFLVPNDDPTSGVKSFAIGGFVLVIGLGLIGTIWRVSVARRIASRAGMDEDAAVAATLFGTGGLTATYLAANLRPQPSPMDPAAVRHVEPPARPAEQRLAELKRLHDEGLIDETEYTSRRTAILDTV